MFRIPKWIFLIFAISSSACLALPEDSKQKVIIASDYSVYNYKTGVNVYEGNVKVDQGTTHITADRLITKNNDEHKMREAIAYGTKERAHYWTIPKINDPQVDAYANIIKFYPIESNVTLEKNVFVKQGDNSFQGELILYNNYDETITVPPSQNGRAVVVYNPEKTKAG